MTIKLFPSLERVSITEHAKSNNYENYIGVVLDKKTNTFKVVEGKFTDKKDMYRKMKKRGFILRKAYESKVWDWIEDNANSPIISYLMLSTAFSKWRSNNVLHKYYQKLLQDIPELNREREKGNPNTRGGDFITTDDKNAPKRKTESIELEEEQRFHDPNQEYYIRLVGMSDPQYSDPIELEDDEKYISDEDITDKHVRIYNKALLDHIERLLEEYDEVKLSFSLNIKDDENKEKKTTINSWFTLPKVQKDKQKLENKIQNMPKPENGIMDQNTAEKVYLKSLAPNKHNEMKLIGIKYDKDIIDEMKTTLTKTKEGVVLDKKLIDTAKELLRYYDAIRIDEWNQKERKYETVKLYNNKYIKSDTYRIKKKEYDIDVSKAVNIKRELEDLLAKRNNPEFINKLTNKEKDEFNSEIDNLKRQYSDAVNEDFYRYFSGTWQSKMAAVLSNDSEESRKSLKNDKKEQNISSDKLLFDKFLSLLLKDNERNSLDTFIEYWDEEGIPLRNTFLNGVYERFRPFSGQEIKQIVKSIRNGKPLSEDETERKALLRNLIWYLIADAKLSSLSKQRASVTLSNMISDLIAQRESFASSNAHNPKLNQGDLNRDIKIGDGIRKIDEKLKALVNCAVQNGVKLPKECEKYLEKNELHSEYKPTKRQNELAKKAVNDYNREYVDSWKELLKTSSERPIEQPEIIPSLAKYITNEIVKRVNEKYNKKITDRIKSEEKYGTYMLKKNALTSYEFQLKNKNPDITEEQLNQKMVDYEKEYEKKLKKYELEHKDDKETQVEEKEKRYAEEYEKDKENEINDVIKYVYKELKEKPKDIRTKDYVIDTLNKKFNSSENDSTNEVPEDKDKTESVEVTQYDNDGAYQLHNSIPYQGKGFEYSAGPIKMTGQIVEDTTKTELNPKLFENDVLIPEVRDALYKIATVFKDYLDLPFEIKDIYFTGSNANYNYTDDSDIDLHLVYDFEQAGVNAELLSKYLIAAKKDFNNKYDIKVKGMPVELGCENINEPLVSTGIYSLGANTWVIKPNNSGIEIPDVDMNAFNDLSMKINDTIKAQNASAIENLWKKIRELRKDSLSKEGEFGMGNLLFKKLRNNHYLDKLRDKMYNTQSKELSLESSEKLQEEELNDRRDYSEYLKDIKNETEAKDTQDLLMDKSLISYLDGYRNRNEKAECKEENGVLNEEEKSNNYYVNKARKAMKYASDDIPPEIERFNFIDEDGTVWQFTYNSRKKELKKRPVFLNISNYTTKREYGDWKPADREELNDLIDLNYDRYGKSINSSYLYDVQNKDYYVGEDDNVYDYKDNIIGKIVMNAYDAEDNIIGELGAGDKVHDDKGNIIGYVDEKTHEVKNAQDNVIGKIIINVYDAKGNIIGTVDEKTYEVHLDKEEPDDSVKGYLKKFVQNADNEINSWYNDKKKALGLDNLLTKEGEKNLRKTALQDLYTFSQYGISDDTLREIKDKYYKTFTFGSNTKESVMNETNGDYKEIEEIFKKYRDERGNEVIKLKNNTKNDISSILKEFGIDPTYLIRPIYEKTEEIDWGYNKNYESVIEHHWRIYSIENTSINNFDPNKIRIKLIDSNEENLSLDEKAPKAEVSINHLKKLIRNDPNNDLKNPNTNKLSGDVTSVQNTARAFLTTSVQNYEWRPLRDYEIKDALDYLRDNQEKQEQLEKELMQLANEISTWDSNNKDSGTSLRTKKGLFNQKRRDLIYLRYNFGPTIRLLNLVQDGIEVKHMGKGYYIKLPTKTPPKLNVQKDADSVQSLGRNYYTPTVTRAKRGY